MDKQNSGPEIPMAEFLRNREMYTVEVVMTRKMRVKVDAQSLAEARRDGLKLIDGDLEDWASVPKYKVTKITKRRGAKGDSHQ